MNWYKNTTTKNDAETIRKAMFSDSQPTEKMVKSAAVTSLYEDHKPTFTKSKSSKPVFTKDKEVPATNQTARYFNMFDIQRYVFDSYAIKTAFSQTRDRFAISVAANHAFLGTITWDMYWFYDLNQFKKAEDTYKTLNKIVEETTTLFVNASGDLPTPMFWTFLKREAEKIDPKATIRSNIPYVNFAKQYAHLSNPDWRSNIYGGRYPKYKERSFTEYEDFRKKLWGK